MDHMGSPPLHPADHHSSTSTKRKRSPSNEPPSQPTPPAKVPKTHANHLQINYLARQFPEILPLISTEDPLPSLLSLISDYDGVLQRHESMAGNLGARPLGPMLIQRFERLFDGPPRVLKTHGKEGTSVGWLDVVDFARNKPEQFNLEKMRDGVRVCQFYTKQCRVEISEEDFLLVKSGMPQKLIPPQPIVEDEEKELGTLEILEKSLSGVVQLADQGRQLLQNWVTKDANTMVVSARARQLNHRLKNRKTAIISRREAEAATAAEEARSLRGAESSYHRSHTNGGDRSSNSPAGGFVAVNSRYPLPSDRPGPYNGSPHSYPQTSNAPIINGTPLHGASAATRAELLSKFHTTSDRPSPSRDSDLPRRLSNPISRSSIPSKPNSNPFTDSMEYANVLMTTASPVPIPNTPSSLLPYQKPSAADRFDDSGPYKGEMMQRMEQLNRGDRVQPPCDRCRRLHMDCLKNLTACMGCTKKHAKCSWKDVEEQELKDHPFVAQVKAPDEGLDTGSDGDGRGSGSGNDVSLRGGHRRKDVVTEKVGVRDEELLGEETGDEDVEMGKVPDRQHSVQSMSPPTITVTRESVQEKVEPLPSPAESKDAQHRPTTQREGAINGSIPSPPAPQGSYALTSERTEQDIDDITVIPAPQYQAPHAQMQSYTPRDTNRTDSHVQTQYEKDIYSQLNETTREHAEPMRVYTAGSEPIQPDSSPTQQQMEAPTTGIQPIDDRPQETEEEPSQPFQTAPMQTEQLPSPPLQSQDLQSTQMPNPPFAGQPMQT